jgi:hypothetical protein
MYIHNKIRREAYLTDLKGENTTRCEYGNWTGIPPICEEIYCPFPGMFTVFIFYK